MVMHVGNSGGSREWQGLLRRRPNWGIGPPRSSGVRKGLLCAFAVADVPDPVQEEGPVLVEAVGGLCGTDREIVAGAYGQAPVGESFLVP